MSSNDSVINVSPQEDVLKCLADASDLRITAARCINNDYEYIPLEAIIRFPDTPNQEDMMEILKDTEAVAIKCNSREDIEKIKKYLVLSGAWPDIPEWADNNETAVNGICAPWYNTGNRLMTPEKDIMDIAKFIIMNGTEKMLCLLEKAVMELAIAEENTRNASYKDDDTNDTATITEENKTDKTEPAEEIKETSKAKKVKEVKEIKENTKNEEKKESGPDAISIDLLTKTLFDYFMGAREPDGTIYQDMNNFAARFKADVSDISKAIDTLVLDQKIKTDGTYIRLNI